LQPEGDDVDGGGVKAKVLNLMPRILKLISHPPRLCRISKMWREMWPKMIMINGCESVSYFVMS
jgi:hypothetical protein